MSLLITQLSDFSHLAQMAQAAQLASHIPDAIAAQSPTFALAIFDSLLDKLTGLPDGSWASAGAGLGWTYGLPAWAWALVIVAALATSWASYRKLVGKPAVRVALAGLRGVIIFLIVVLLAGPVLVIPRERIEPDRVIYLVDHSESMRVADHQIPDAENRTSRYLALKEKVMASAEKLPGATATRRVSWMGFDDHLFSMQKTGPADPSAPPSAAGTPKQIAVALAQVEADQVAAAKQVSWPTAPTGQDTRLRHAIEQALAQTPDQPIAGIVVMSDGRSSEPVTADLTRRLQARGVPVYSVPLGEPAGTFDISVATVDYPDRAFVKDIVPVNITIEQTPDAATIDPSTIKASLIDTVTGKVLDEAVASQSQGRISARLVGSGQTPGPVRWKVQITHDSTGSSRETVLDNNTQDISPTLVDRPIGVLYIEGYPRWEYRYLKTLLVREGTFTSSLFLLSADRDFPQEGTRPITRLPETAEELAPYDLIILGDVDPTYFSPQQIKLLRDHVAIRGAGVLWIGGEYFTPKAYESNALASLLPMRRPGQVGRVRSDMGLLAMRPTAQAGALGVMRLDNKTSINQFNANPAAVAGPAIPGWPATLPGLIYAQDIGALKPGAEALSLLVPFGDLKTNNLTNAIPGVVRSRYGAGQIVYTTTDETWRWRFGVGELYFEPYWVQLIRMLARSRLLDGAGRASITVASRRPIIDQPTTIEITLSDQTLIDRNLQSITVGIFEAGRPGDTPLETLRLGRVSRPDNAGPAEYRAVWRPGTTGDRVLRVTEPGLQDMSIQRPVTVFSKPGEMRNPLPDHAALALLAKQSSGQVVPLETIEDLGTLIPDRSRRTPDDIKLPIWNSSLALVLIVTLLTVEWVGRRLIRLV